MKKYSFQPENTADTTTTRFSGHPSLDRLLERSLEARFTNFWLEFTGHRPMK